MGQGKLGNLVCIAGGGMPQIENAIGVLKAITERGVIFDQMWGTSAGAITSSLFMSFLQDIKKLESTVRNSTAADWFIIKPWQAIKSFFGLSNYVADNTGFKTFLEQTITQESWKKVKVAVTDMGPARTEPKVSGTKMLTGKAEHVLASMSFQNVFPPVILKDGRMYADGGVYNNCPLPKYLDLSRYNHIYLILAASSPILPKSRWRFLNRLFNVIDSALDREMYQLKELGLDEAPNITVFSPDKWVQSASFLNWSKGFEQIDVSYEFAKRVLDQKEREAHHEKASPQ